MPFVVKLEHVVALYHSFISVYSSPPLSAITVRSPSRGACSLILVECHVLSEEERKRVLAKCSLISSFELNTRAATGGIFWDIPLKLLVRAVAGKTIEQVWNKYNEFFHSPTLLLRRNIMY